MTHVPPSVRVQSRGQDVRSYATTTAGPNRSRAPSSRTPEVRAASGSRSDLEPASLVRASGGGGVGGVLQPLCHFGIAQAVKEVARKPCYNRYHFESRDLPEVATLLRVRGRGQRRRRTYSRCRDRAHTADKVLAGDVNRS
jgi:hypothetical protein